MVTLPISTSVTQGTAGTTYEYLIYGHSPKINISYQGNPGKTNQYQIYNHFLKINTSYQGATYPIYIFIFPIYSPIFKSVTRVPQVQPINNEYRTHVVTLVTGVNLFDQT